MGFKSCDAPTVLGGAPEKQAGVGVCQDDARRMNAQLVKGGPAAGGPPASGQKTKFCMYHLQGVCKHTGDSCPFAHSTEEMRQARGGSGGSRRTAGQPKHLAWPQKGPRSPQPGTSRSSEKTNGHLGSATTSYASGTRPSFHRTEATRPAWPTLEEPMFVAPIASAIPAAPLGGDVLESVHLREVTHVPLVANRPAVSDVKELIALSKQLEELASWVAQFAPVPAWQPGNDPALFQSTSTVGLPRPVAPHAPLLNPEVLRRLVLQV